MVDNGSTDEGTNRLRALSYVLDACRATGAERVGKDDSGAVTVTMDASGRTSDIRVADGWRNRLAPDTLPGAITQAATAARRAGAMDMFAVIAALPDELGDVAVPASYVAPSPQVAPRTVEEFVDRAPDPSDVLAQLEQALQAVTRLSAVPAAPPRAATPSREQPVTFLTDSAGAVVACEIDEGWLAAYRGDALNDVLQDALSSHQEGARP